MLHNILYFDILYDILLCDSHFIGGTIMDITETGMTDLQFKYELRRQLENWEDVTELLDNGDLDGVRKKAERIIIRIKASLMY